MDNKKTEEHYQQIRERGYNHLTTFLDGRVACAREGVGYIYVPVLINF